MARQPVSTDKTENRLSDEDFDEWETISSDFGTKIEWGDKAGETPMFIGTYVGPRIIEMEDGESAKAAEFFSEETQEKYYCWQGYSISAAIDAKEMEPGDVVRIKYMGEKPTKRGLNPVKVLEIKRKPRS